MFKSLRVSGFRCLRNLRVDGLTRVNLFVGTNNAGKTSLLEAVEVLCLPGVAGIVQGLRRREERIYVGGEAAPRILFDVSHVFMNHELHPGASFTIEGDGPRPALVRCEIESFGSQANLFEEGEEEEEEGAQSSMALRISSRELPSDQIVQLSADGGLLDAALRRISLKYAEDIPPIHFLTTEPARPSQLGQLWDAVVLTPEEQSVGDAMRIIEPKIERIAFLGTDRLARSVLIKLANEERRLPLGSVGDGLKRLLALALHLIPAKGGVLLVDEIDTGLHHTVMTDMWRLVIETAQRLDIQVFATTHSLDCVRALAWVRDSLPHLGSEVALHRLEKNMERSVTYTLDEVALAARHHVEVR